MSVGKLTAGPSPATGTAHLEALQRPHGRIHFAGEHTSVLRSTMEGALRSGIRTANEVNEA
ncbi:MAG: FAD-dependent oxidoreductase [Candidatus Palauibacterales bacterium]|nr:FAD-dependent oxidoreductase [Candidatus Palauibacterales bacterium]